MSSTCTIGRFLGVNKSYTPKELNISGSLMKSIPLPLAEGTAGLKLGMVLVPYVAIWGDRRERQVEPKSLPFTMPVVLCLAGISSSPFLLPSSVSKLGGQ